MNTRALLYCCLGILSLPLPSFGVLAQSSTTNWNLTIIERLLSAAGPEQKLIQVGDMEIPVQRLRAWRDRLAGERSSRLSADGGTSLWPGGNVYYTFDADVSAAKRKVFLDGAAEWAMFANLTFIPRTSQPNYILILENLSMSGGQSAVGMVGGQQQLQLGLAAWNRLTVCHELGHALGMIHEHQRSDRDTHVVVLPDNILPGAEANFVLLGDSLDQGAYDFLSVMHYRRNALSIDAATLNTLEPKSDYSQFLNLMGNQLDPVLSPLDRAGVAALYGAGPVLSPVVTTTQDSGPGSLRAALYYALDHPGTTITFNIPLSDPGFADDVFTIQPTDALPQLARATVLDGTSQPGNSNLAGPDIILNGALCVEPSVYVNGLTLKGTNCVVSGLIVNGFNRSGIVIQGFGATGNVVRGCHFGINAAGNAAVANSLNALEISDGASGNLIGGLLPSDRNTISGSAYQGLLIHGSGTRSNRVQGNFIGLTPSGTAALPNAWAGLEIRDGAEANQIGGTAAGAANVISGNTLPGITLSEFAQGNVIEGNLIGVNFNATAAVPNGWAGITLIGGARSNRIGGYTAASRNLISGNTFQGIAISDPGSDGNLIAGNAIGVNAAGSGALGNGWSGIDVYAGPRFTVIGGIEPGAANHISGNGNYGIHLNGSARDTA